MSRRELQYLIFHSAAVYQDDSGSMSSVQINLRSATRVVTVRVSDLRSANPKVETLADTLTDESP